MNAKIALELENNIVYVRKAEEANLMVRVVVSASCSKVAVAYHCTDFVSLLPYFTCFVQSTLHLLSRLK